MGEAPPPAIALFLGSSNKIALLPGHSMLLLFPKFDDAGVPMIPLHKACDLPESICKSIIILLVDRSSNPDDCHVVWVIPGRAETGSAFVITNG